MPVGNTVFKHTQIFDGHGAGWSESIYVYGTGIGGVRVETNLLMFERDDMLGLGYSGSFARITKYNDRRQTLFYPSPLEAGSHEDGDTPWNAVLARLVAANGMRRSLMLRGWPDKCFTNGNFTPIPSVGFALTRYYARLRNGSFAIVGINPDNVKKPYISIEPSAVVTFGAAHGFNPGDIVYLVRAKDTTGKTIRGRTSVIEPVTANTLTLKSWPLGATSFVGSLRKYDLVDSVIVDAFTERAALRKVGRPFGLYRGRASKRV